MATIFPVESPKTGCKGCHKPLDFDFTFAFQPIVDIEQRNIFGYEALVRDQQTQTAKAVLDRVNDENRYAFDQACRVKAIRLANQLRLDSILSINFLPNAVYEPEHCIQSTLKAAKECGFPTSKIMFEITESEQVADVEHLRGIFQHYQRQGFITALDDFGAGHAGLNTLASFIPNLLKVDMELVKNIDQDPVKQIIVSGLIEICRQLNITVLAEGLETREEVLYFQQLGVKLMQGFFFARPGYESLPEVDFDGLN